MSTRTPGKKSAGSGTKSNTKRKPKTRSKPGTQSGGKPGARSGAKKDAARKSAPKSGDRKKKPVASKSRTAGAGKKAAGSKAPSRWRAYVLGLSLGVLIGVLGAVVLFWMYQAGKPAPRPAAKAKPAAKPVATKKARPRRTRVVYEETHHVERLTKEIDQGIFTAFTRMNVPEEDIRILRVTHMRDKGRSWDHTAIEAVLPAGLAPTLAVKNLARTLDGLGLSPKPVVSVQESAPGLTAGVMAGGMGTHTIHLIESGAAPTTVKKPGPAPVTGRKPRVAIVIDDFGDTEGQARQFAGLPCPVVFSVLPFLSRSKDVAHMAHTHGRQVMLHLPMQPAQWPDVDAGPGALLVSMDRKEIQSRVTAALNAVPHIVGVNNHMGSRFTEDRDRIRWALEPIKERGLFFLDSRTSMRSRAFQEAGQLGLPTARRTTFLDNVQSPQAIRIQLKKMVSHARHHGRAIAIGHIYPVTCQVLKSEYNYLKSYVDLVPIHTMMKSEKHVRRN